MRVFAWWRLRPVNQVGQAEIGRERIAVVQRLAEMLARLQEDDGQPRVDARDHVQEHGRIGAEGRHGRQRAGPEAADRQRHDGLGVEVAVALFQRRGLDLGFAGRIKRL